MTALTVRQSAIVAAIRDHHARHGFAPSLREIAVAAGLTSPSSVAHHVHRLTALGVLRCVPGQPRSLALADNTQTGDME